MPEAKFNPKHWTNDYLVLAAPKDRYSLAIMRECESGDAAIEIFNRDVRIKRGKKKQPKAMHAVRITTFEGTISQLKAKGYKPPKPKKKTAKHPSLTALE